MWCCYICVLLDKWLQMTYTCFVWCQLMGFPLSKHPVLNCCRHFRDFFRSAWKHHCLLLWWMTCIDTATAVPTVSSKLWENVWLCVLCGESSVYSMAHLCCSVSREKVSTWLGNTKPDGDQRSHFYLNYCKQLYAINLFIFQSKWNLPVWPWQTWKDLNWSQKCDGLSAESLRF